MTPAFSRRRGTPRRRRTTWRLPSRSNRGPTRTPAARTRTLPANISSFPGKSSRSIRPTRGPGPGSKRFGQGGPVGAARGLLAKRIPTNRGSVRCARQGSRASGPSRRLQSAKSTRAPERHFDPAWTDAARRWGLHLTERAGEMRMAVRGRGPRDGPFPAPGPSRAGEPAAGERLPREGLASRRNRERNGSPERDAGESVQFPRRRSATAVRLVAAPRRTAQTKANPTGPGGVAELESSFDGSEER